MAYKVGGDVDYRCTRCKMELAHTILAMVDGLPVQVKCNTCHSTRKYRAKSRRSSTTSRTSRSTSARRPRMTSTSSRPDRPSVEEVRARRQAAAAADAQTAAARTEKWAALMAKADAGAIARRSYNMRERFEVGQVIDHRKFGGGVVEAIVDKKIRVVFSDGERLLIHDRKA